MGQAIASPTNDERDLALRWSNSVSLTPRILAVNIFALAMLAGGFFYLDSFRARIVDERVAQASREIRLVAQSLSYAPPERRDAVLLHLARSTGTRIRLFDMQGKLQADSRRLGLRNVVFRDPDKDPFGQTIARALDALIDTVVGAARAPLYREQPPDEGLDWPDVRTVATSRGAPATVWRAPDRTTIITAAAAYGPNGIVMTTVNARDITQTVRNERYRLGVVLLIVSTVSVLLSLFLARTIVRPLRRLARAAMRVRLGRARDVVVPRLPARADEIGRLARALSDMTQALRARIDATEAFAADVAHELKNPLASMRSAVEGLSQVKDPKHQASLLAIVRDDVHRLDRLISDISDASRLDAQLSRATFEPVDVSALVGALIDQRVERGLPRGIRIAFEHDPEEALIVLAEGARLERVFENLIENAISFSPDGGLITVGAREDELEMLEAWVEDEGPGVPEEAREAIFRRFHSIRPENEAFGQHSGLGLAIARTIVEAHQGTISVESRMDRANGARFVVRMPLVRS